MWLLNTEKVQLKWFSSPNEVTYAILSHVWGNDEQSFQDTPHCAPNTSRSALRRARDRAFRRPSLKIRNACARARHDGFRWLWVDTCCINKANSAELSEAINSMYAWYAASSMCYAFLHDVPSGEDPNAPNSAFRSSRWFKRGWTLQELIAPHSIIFLAQDWTPIGPKRRLAPLIERVTGIDRQVLTHKRSLNDVSVACRMSWAAGRQTTRIEDEAYALMGIFGVYMSTIYGEGRHAFVRLQEEILKRCPDQTIFAWGRVIDDHQGGKFVASAQAHDYAPQARAGALLAPSPAEFAGCADLRPLAQREFAEKVGVPEGVPEYSHTSSGVRTTFPLIAIAHTSEIDAALALLACQDSRGRLVGLYLRSHSALSASSKYFVGGFIARGGRRIHYYRGARLALSDLGKPVGSSSGKSAGMWGLPTPREVHVHAESDHTAERRTVIGRPESTIESSRSSSMVFFEPPCTIVLSTRSVERLRRMGYVDPNIPSHGFRLEESGDYRSMSFIGHESFTVHMGICPLDVTTSVQKAQLWATVRFDRDIDILLKPERAQGTTPWMSLGKGKDPIIPDQSMLVQSWKSARATFGKRDKQVRLTFSYPCSATAEHPMAEVYELDIRYEGYYQVGGTVRKRTQRSSTIGTTVGSVLLS